MSSFNSNLTLFNRNMFEAEHAGFVLLDEAETALRQLLSGQRVTSQELTKALSAQ